MDGKVYPVDRPPRSIALFNQPHTSLRAENLEIRKRRGEIVRISCQAEGFYGEFGTFTDDGIHATLKGDHIIAEKLLDLIYADLSQSTRCVPPTP
jgi:hypothetical protein